jgi:hypothetical protein
VYRKTGNGDFADILAQTDTYIGELLNAIEELGIKDDTIFIFTSDNLVITKRGLLPKSSSVKRPDTRRLTLALYSESIYSECQHMAT